MAKRKPCRIKWTSRGRKVKASVVRKAMGGAYDIHHADICRKGPTTVRVKGRPFYGVPMAKGRPQRRR